MTRWKILISLCLYENTQWTVNNFIDQLVIIASSSSCDIYIIPYDLCLNNQSKQDEPVSCVTTNQDYCYLPFEDKTTLKNSHFSNDIYLILIVFNNGSINFCQVVLT